MPKMKIARLLSISICLLILVAPATGKDRILLSRTKSEVDRAFKHPIMVRELFRQAFLIAARDSLGTLTSDEVLGDSMNAGAQDAVFSPQVDFKDDMTVVSFYALDSETPVWTKEYSYADTQVDIGRVAELVESLSREDFVNVIRSRLAKPIAPPQADENRDNLGDEECNECEERINTLDPFEQILAIERLHKKLHDKGPSPKLYGQLARAYANLYQLTLFCIEGTPKAIAARALLYAERAVALYPTDHYAKISRGYARAMIGTPRYAMADLMELRRNDPYWAKMAKLLVTQDYDKLEELKDDDVATSKLAAFMAFLASENCLVPRLSIDVAERSLEKLPGCCRMLNHISLTTGAGLANSTTQRSVDDWVMSCLNFGKESELLDRNKDLNSSFKQLVKALRASSVESEFYGFGNLAIARLMEDGLIVNLCHLVRHLEEKIVQNTNRLCESYRPVLGEHRHWSLVESFRDNQRKGDNFYSRLKETIVLDTAVSAMPFRSWYFHESLKNTEHSMNLLLLVRGTSPCTSELERFLPMFAGNFGRQNDSLRETVSDFIARIQAFAPDSPNAVGAYAMHHPDESKSHWGEYLDKYESSPSVNVGVGFASMRAEEYKITIRAFERITRVAADPTVYQQLAEAYLRTGREDLWERTLIEFVDQPSVDLVTAGVNVKLARHYEAKGDPERALSFAEAAASTGAQWAMECLADIYGALDRWDEAEDLIKAISERYEYTIGHLRWCARTGHGDIRSAAKRAYEYEKTLNSRNVTCHTRYFLRMWVGDPVEKELIEEFTNKFDGWGALHGVFYAWSKEDDELRNQCLKTLLEREPVVDAKPPKQVFEGFHRLGMLIKAHFDDGTHVSTEKFDELIAAYPDRASALEFFSGWYFELIGEKKTAISYYKKCTERKGDKLDRDLAAVFLRRIGE